MNIEYMFFNETELRAFFRRHYCPFAFYSMSLFKEEEKKKGSIGINNKNARSSVSSVLLKLLIGVENNL